MSYTKIVKGESFLMVDGKCDDVVVPELFSPKQNELIERCRQFIAAEILPRRVDIDKGDRELMKSLVISASRKGFSGITIPVDLLGGGETVVNQMIVAMSTGDDCSFSTPFMAHSGLGMLPILYYGNRKQQEKYLTRLCSGEFIGAFCLTEPTAGSDASAGKTTATLLDDGNYVLNGNKTWITNAGIADVQIVLAKVGSDRVATAFIVEADSEGITIGRDIAKMGIKGSPTAAIHYNNVKVPAENLLGRRGEGLRIALNTLIMGKMNLCASAIGASQAAIQIAFDYSQKRVQFGAPLFTFGAIKYKLASQIAATFAVESALYRAAGEIDEMILKSAEEGLDYGKRLIEVISLFSLEAAMLKVKGAEVLDFVADETVQICGGAGYAAGSSAEKIYRDARINKIFEGTNEINRTIIADALLKIMKRGSREKGICYRAEDLPRNEFDLYVETAHQISGFKDVFTICMNLINAKFGVTLLQQQELLMNIADIAIEIYVCESLFFRVAKLEKLCKAVAVTRYMLDFYMFDTAFKVKKAAYNIASSAAGDEDLLPTIDSLTKPRKINVMNIQRVIADSLLH